MPELPEVETVVRGLRPVLEKARLARVSLARPDLRFPLPEGFVQYLTGRKVKTLSRRGKYILATLDEGTTWITHLGMSGRFTIDAPDGEAAAERRASAGQAGHEGGFAFADKHDHVLIETDKGARLRFNDVRRFGFMDLAAPGTLDTNRHLAELGPEPLSRAFTAEHLLAEAKGRTAPLKTFLLDQKIVAGLGNIYVSEALFSARLSPLKPAGELTKVAAERLVRGVRRVLEAAIEAGGSSLRDYVQASGELGYFQHQFAVYGKEGEPCEGCRCEFGVERIVQSGRSTYWCPRKQK